MSYKISLYSPIQVEYGDQKFTLRKLNRGMFRILEDFEKKERAAKNSYEKIEVLYDELKAFIDAPPEVIDDLDTDQVQELKDIIDDVVFKKKQQQKAEAEKTEEIAEKNGPKPGEETVLS